MAKGVRATPPFGNGEGVPNFVYIRLHGPEMLYGGQYSDAALDRWAERIRAWAAGGGPEDAQRISGTAARRRSARYVFCYFDNDQKAREAFDARRLIERLSPDSPLALEPLTRKP